MNEIYPVMPENLTEEDKEGVTSEMIDAMEEFLSTFVRSSHPTISLERALVECDEVHDLYLEVTGRFRNKQGDGFAVTPLGVVNVSDLVRRLKSLL